GDPAEYFYGTAFVDMLSQLRDSGQWEPINNKIAIVAGSFPYSQVVAQAIVEAAPGQGWEVAFGPETVAVPTTEWGSVISRVREANVAAIANTHFFASDIAAFTTQFTSNPTNSLLWFPFGALFKAFT
ncbi:periplasmic binding family protein, partial [Brucella grignonensis]